MWWRPQILMIPMMKRSGINRVAAPRKAALPVGSFTPGHGAALLCWLLNPTTLLTVALISFACQRFLLHRPGFGLSSQKRTAGFAREELPKFSDVMRKGWYYLFTIGGGGGYP